MQPIVSKAYCSSSDAVLLVRRRPKVANGGGFAVVDAGDRVIFTVDGCGILGKKEEVMLRDGEGNAMLLIRHKGAVIEALSLTRKWRGFSYDDLFGSSKLIFTLKEPNTCCSSRIPIRISLESNQTRNYENFEVRGDFSGGSCAIINAAGHLIAQIGMAEVMMSGKDLYRVKIMAGVDQAFVFGVIAVLDYIHGGSTRC